MLFPTASQLLSFALVVFSCMSFAMEKAPKPEYYSIVLPGQNGMGGESFPSNNIINTSKRSVYRTLEEVARIDMGQENCIADFEEQLAADPELQKDAVQRPKILLYGVSQGSATVINWLAKKSHAEQEQLVKCVFLEAVLGAGNSAIKHTAKTFAPFTDSLFFPTFLMPWAVKAYPFRSYKPWGVTAIASAEKISPNIPVIIMHNTRDPQLSIDDARQLYCALRNNNHNNAYLLEVDGQPAHINILYSDSAPERIQKIAAIQAIYRKHELPYVQVPEIENYCHNLQKVQPTVQEVLRRR